LCAERPGINGTPCYTFVNYSIILVLRASHNMQVFILSLISGLLLWPIVGSAGLYKWTDDQGNLHITDTPPPGAQKKSSTASAPAPRSTLPKKAAVRPTLPEQPLAEVHPVHAPIVHSSASEEVPLQRAMEGLSPSQATLTSSWQLFDSTEMKAKAPVQRWKDEQGLDHVVDVLPTAGEATETGARTEGVSASRSRQRAKERATSVSRSRHQSAE
jgi:Domain of unknown function (DUF4124)